MDQSTEETPMPMTAGFYWVKIWENAPWSVVFVYSDGSWSAVWWADPRSGLIGDLAELGPCLEAPDGERHSTPVNPIGQLEATVAGLRELDQQYEKASWPEKNLLEPELERYRQKIEDLSSTMEKRKPPQ